MSMVTWRTPDDLTDDEVQTLEAATKSRPTQCVAGPDRQTNCWTRRSDLPRRTRRRPWPRAMPLRRLRTTGRNVAGLEWAALPFSGGARKGPCSSGPRLSSRPTAPGAPEGEGRPDRPGSAKPERHNHPEGSRARFSSLLRRADTRLGHPGPQSDPQSVSGCRTTPPGTVAMSPRRPSAVWHSSGLARVSHGVSAGNLTLAPGNVLSPLRRSSPCSARTVQLRP